MDETITYQGHERGGAFVCAMKQLPTGRDVWLQVNATDTVTQALYERLGFTMVDQTMEDAAYKQRFECVVDRGNRIMCACGGMQIRDNTSTRREQYNITTYDTICVPKHVVDETVTELQHAHTKYRRDRDAAEEILQPTRDEEIIEAVQITVVYTQTVLHEMKTGQDDGHSTDSDAHTSNEVIPGCEDTTQQPKTTNAASGGTSNNQDDEADGAMTPDAAAAERNQQQGGTNGRRVKYRRDTTKVAEIRDNARWRTRVIDGETKVIEFRHTTRGWEKWYYVRPSLLRQRKGMGLFAARQFAARDYMTVYVGREVSEAKWAIMRKTDDGQHVMMIRSNGATIPVDGRYDDGQIRCAHMINYGNSTGLRHMQRNAKMDGNGNETITAMRDIKYGEEVLMGHGRHYDYDAHGILTTKAVTQIQQKEHTYSHSEMQYLRTRTQADPHKGMSVNTHNNTQQQHTNAPVEH